MSQSLIAAGFGASFVPGGIIPILSCCGVGLLAHLVPALIELAFPLGDPLLRHVVRRVSRPRREVDEERLVRRHGLLVLDPGHCLVGHIGHEVVVRIMRQFYLGDAIEQVRRPLVRLAADEAVELVETLVRGPAVKGTGDAGLPGSGLVPFAERRGAVAVQPQHFGHRCRCVGNLARCARETGPHLGDEAHVHGVVVAA